MKRTQRLRMLRFTRNDLYELFICLLLAGLFVMLSSGAAFGQGNVGINNAAPHAKSLLDLTSNDKGLLTPRMTSAQRIAMFPVADASAKGMLVYQTDGAQGFYYYDGAAWVMVQSGNAGWGLAGNAGTASAANFIGTTDNQALAFRTNNVERARIDAIGNMGIGTTTPGYRLHAVTDVAFAVGEFKNTNAAGWSGLHFSSSNGAAQAHFGFGNASAPLWANMGYAGTTTGNPFVFTTSNTERMRIGADGNFGIGNTAPTCKLDVMDNGLGLLAKFQGTNPSNYSTVHWMRSDGEGAQVGYFNPGAPGPMAGNFVVGSMGNTPVSLITGNQERVRLTTSGNVGIGNAAPTSKLQVTRQAAGYAPNLGSALTVEGTGPVYSSILSSNDETGLLFGASNDPQNGGIIYNSGAIANGMQFRTGGNATRMIINSTGAVTVGHGISWPAYPFGVIASNANSAPIGVRNLDDSGIGGVHYFGSGGSLGGVTGWNNAGNPIAPHTLVHGTLSNMPATFITNSTERMRIAPNGNLGLGTNVTNVRLQVASDQADVVSNFYNSNAAGYAGMHYDNNSGGRAHMGFGGSASPSFANVGYSGTSSAHPFVLSTSNMERMRIAANGNVGVGTTAPASLLHVARGAAGFAPNANSALTVENNGNAYASILTASGETGLLFGGAGAAEHGGIVYQNAGGMSLRTGGNIERMRIVANGNVGVGTATPTSKLEVNGFTKLGTDAPAIKVKKLTGTTAAAEGGTAPIAHGLTSSKIIGVQVLIEYSAGNWISTGYTINPEYQADYVVGATNITIYNQGTNSGLILNKPVKILVTYEE